MSKICEVTGKKVMFGNNVSFSINKTKRRFDVNVSKKKFYVPEEDRWVSLNVSSKGLKIIDKKGISNRKSTRLNSSHVKISYAVFCLKKKKKIPLSSERTNPVNL